MLCKCKSQPGTRQFIKNLEVKEAATWPLQNQASLKKIEKYRQALFLDLKRPPVHDQWPWLIGKM